MAIFSKSKGMTVKRNRLLQSKNLRKSIKKIHGMIEP